MKFGVFLSSSVVPGGDPIFESLVLIGLFLGSIMGRMWQDLLGSFTPYGL